MKNKKGFAFLPVLFGIIIIAALVGGGAYVYTKNQHKADLIDVELTPAASGTSAVATNTSVPQTVVPVGTPPVISQTVADNKTFMAGEYGFTISYPSDLVVTTNKNIFDVQVPVQGSDENPGEVSVTTTGNTKHCEDVPADPNGTLGIVDNGTVSIHGADFKSISHSATSAGQGYKTTQYTTVYNGACYGIVITTNSSIQNITDSILNSFTFLPIVHDPTKVADLKQYDSSFGYSFWMPQNWVLTGTDINSSYGASITSKRLDIGNVISITELTLPEGGYVRDSGASGTHGPVTYSFDPLTKKWMVEWEKGSPENGSTATTTAVAAFNTIGQLPIFTGSSHFSSMFIPLSSTKILFIGDEGAVDSRYLALTIVPAGVVLANSAVLGAEKAEANEYFGGASTYP